jgi:hypothetical protein
MSHSGAATRQLLVVARHKHIRNATLSPARRQLGAALWNESEAGVAARRGGERV